MYIDIPKYNLSKDEKYQHLFFWVCVAGHTSKTVQKSINNMIGDLLVCFPDFHTAIKSYPYMREMLIKHKIGCYEQRLKTLSDLRNDINFDSIESLEQIYGVGKKTSRGFYLHHIDREANYACLDTHILKFLRKNGIDTPKTTPSGKEYTRLEKEFLKLANSSGMSVAEFDYQTWKEYAE